MTHSSYPILCQTALEESNHTEDISVYHLPFLASLPRRLETLHMCQGTVLTQSILQHYLLSLEYILIISTNQKQAYLQQLCPNTFPECLPEMTSPFLASSAHRAFGRTLCFASLTGLCCDFSESMIYKTRKLIKYFKCSKYLIYTKHYSYLKLLAYLFQNVNPVGLSLLSISSHDFIYSWGYGFIHLCTVILSP